MFWSGSNWEPERFLKSVREVFTSNPNRQDCLRDAVVAVARRYHTSLKKEKEFVAVVNEVKGSRKQSQVQESYGYRFSIQMYLINSYFSLVQR